MSLERFSREYTRRIHSDGTYHDASDSSTIRRLAKWSNLQAPSLVGRSLLLFGSFHGRKTIDCLPWVVGPNVECPERFDEGAHSFAIGEVIDGTHGFKESRYTYKSPAVLSTRVIHQSWTGYIWRDDRPDSFVLVVPDHFEATDDDYDTKLAA